MLLADGFSLGLERAASTMNRLIDDKRNRIGGDYLSKQLFLKTAPLDLIISSAGKAHEDVVLNGRSERRTGTHNDFFGAQWPLTKPKNTAWK